MICIDRYNVKCYPIIFEEDVRMLLIDMGYKKMTTNAGYIYECWRKEQAEKLLLNNK